MPLVICLVSSTDQIYHRAANLVICLVSSTDQIYYLAASRLGDKFDRSMTLGK